MSYRERRQNDHGALVFAHVFCVSCWVAVRYRFDISVRYWVGVQFIVRLNSWHIYA